MTKPRRLKGHKDTVTCCIASRERPGVVATSAEDGCICWFDMRCKDVMFTMDLGKKPISAICFKPGLWKLERIMGLLEVVSVYVLDVNKEACEDGSEDFLYASSGTEVMCFDVHMASSWKPIESYNYNKEEINQIACSSKASFLAAADDSGDVKIIDIRQQCLYKTLRAGHTSICSSVQFLPWRPWEVITGGLDAKLVMWDFSKGRPYKIMDFGLPDISNHSSSGGQCFNPAFIHAIAIPDVDMLDKSGKICAVARGDGVVDIIDIELELTSVKGKASTKPQKKSQLKSEDLKPKSDTTVDPIKGKRLHLDGDVGGHAASVSTVSFSLFGERGKFIISGGNDAFVKVWDWSKHLDGGQNCSSSNLLRQNINLSKKVNWICTTPSDSENLVVCDTSKVVKVYTVV